MRYIFNGLRSWDAQPHKFKDFTKGKIYTMWFSEYKTRFTESDNKEKVDVSNNALKKYFIETI